MEKAEQQQRRDSDELFRHAQGEFEAYVKHYQRLKNNVDLFVERSNHELANLALLIEQKRQNLLTLDQMRQGQAVPHAEPVSKVGQNFTPPPEVAAGPVRVVPPANGATPTGVLKDQKT